jgi:hypothetical protein
MTRRLDGASRLAACEGAVRPGMKLKIDLSCRNQFGVARSKSLTLAVAGMINDTVDEDAEKPGVGSVEVHRPAKTPYRL